MVFRPAKERRRRHRLAPGLILALVLAAQASAVAFASLMVAYHPGGGEGASGNPGYSSAVSAVVPFRLTESLVRRAKAAGLVYEFHPLEGKGHAAWERMDDYIAWIAPFLYKHMIRAPRQAPR